MLVIKLKLYMDYFMSIDYVFYMIKPITTYFTGLLIDLLI